MTNQQQFPVREGPRVFYLQDTVSEYDLWREYNLSAIVDADLGPQDLLLRFQYSNTHTHGLQTSCGGKGAVWPLSQEESTSQRLGHSLKGGGPRALG